MSGKDFEDRLADSLESTVEDDGVVMLRKQSWSTRRGSFQMSQEADVLVDSLDSELYSAFECKSRNHKKTRERGLTGLYFSSDYEPEQIHKQAEYRDLSGRRFFVAVELRDYDGEDYACFLVPLELFVSVEESDEAKVTWEQIAYIGRYIGGEELNITRKDLKAVEAAGVEYCRNGSRADEWVDKQVEEEADWKTTFPPVID